MDANKISFSDLVISLIMIILGDVFRLLKIILTSDLQNSLE